MGRWSKVGKVAVISVTFLVVCAAVAYNLTDVPSTAATYDSALKRAKELGLAMNAEEAEAMRTVPESENCASFIKPLSVHILEVKDKRGKETGTFIEKAVQTWPLLESDYPAIKLAIARPHMRFPFDVRDPLDEADKENSGVSIWITLLVNRAKAYEAEGNRTKAIDLMTSAAKLALLLGDDCTITANSRRMSNVDKVLRAIIEWTRKHIREREWCEGLEAIASIVDQPYNTMAVIKFEHWRYVCFTEIRLGLRPDPRPPGDDDDYAGADRAMIRWCSIVPRFKKALLSRLHNYFDLVASEWPNDDFDVDSIHRISSDVDSYFSNSNLSMAAGWQYMPSFESVESTRRREMSYINVIRQSLELKRTDPAKGLPMAGHHKWDRDGKPIRLIRAKDGWRVYSIGNDLVDDRGMPVDKNGRGDLVINIPSP